MIDYNNNFIISRYQYSRNEMEAANRALNVDLNDALKINEKFENDFASFFKVKHVLACCNGTAAMLEAMWACGVGEGTEIIAPAMTYWASVYPAYTLGAKVKYVDIDLESLCINPEMIEKSITEKTKAIIIVHLYGHPCDMDKIMSIAKKHNIFVIEDFSHAHGAKYKNKQCGTIGDIGIASCMMEKPFPLPEGGVICTNKTELYERCCAFGHYRYLNCIEDGKEKKQGRVTDNRLLAFAGTSIGTIKNRMNPVSAAIGIEFLKNFPNYIEEINEANNYFIDKLEETGLFIGHRIKQSNCSMGGWYMPKLFVKNGNNKEIANSIIKSGYNCYAGHKYYCLADHIINKENNYFRNSSKLFELESINNEIGKIKFNGVEESNNKLLSMPRFLKFNKEYIDQYIKLYINAVRKES